MKTGLIATSLSAMMRLLLVIVLLAAQNACTHSKRRDSIPIPAFQSVAIVNKGATSELRARFGMDPEDSKVTAGATTGAVIAGSGAALACGPFIFLCAVAVINFAAVGAISGGLASEGADAMKNVPYEKLVALDRQFVQISQQRTINLEIEDSLMGKVAPDRVTDNQEADALLQFRLYDIQFSKTYSGKFALTLKTVMLFKWDRNLRSPSSTSRVYEFTSLALPFEDWVQYDGKNLNEAFDTCIEGLTNQMIKDIRFQRLRQ